MIMIRSIRSLLLVDVYYVRLCLGPGLAIKKAEWCRQFILGGIGFSKEISVMRGPEPKIVVCLFINRLRYFWSACGPLARATTAVPSLFKFIQFTVTFLDYRPDKFAFIWKSSNFWSKSTYFPNVGYHHNLAFLGVLISKKNWALGGDLLSTSGLKLRNTTPLWNFWN